MLTGRDAGSCHTCALIEEDRNDHVGERVKPKEQSLGDRVANLNSLLQNGGRLPTLDRAGAGGTMTRRVDSSPLFDVSAGRGHA